ncbi:myb-related protein A [Callorhinchus milii]|uniref:myb-related protein A n=1 Tax=Callorhinchus milii TaxID=7868 RepID=UPI001C3F7817|nr:myb-related protein A [Callorhinchus milii]
MAKRGRSEDDEEEHQFQDRDYEMPQQKGGKKLCNKVKWTPDEDEKLKKLVEENGTEDWNFIANHFVNRTDVQCQHRWQKVLNPELIKGPWTKEEDQKVIDLVQKYGPKRWSLIAKYLKGRIGKQCRERWHNHLNPEVKKSSWTEEEDKIIYDAHKRLGNRWAEIAKLLPGRTDNSIKNHWNSTMRRKVEQEGYLQTVPKCDLSISGVQPKAPRAPLNPMQFENQFFIPVPTQAQGHQYLGTEEGCIENVQDTAGFPQQPYLDDDPDKEQRIKELEILLMSAENEVRRKRAPHEASGFTSWSRSFFGDDSLSSTLSSLEEKPSETFSKETLHGPNPPVQQTSLNRFFAQEQSAVLNTLQSIPDFAKTFELIEADPVVWNEISNFDLSEVTEKTPTRQTSAKHERLQTRGGIAYRFDGRAVSDLSGSTCSNSSGQGDLIPIASPIVAKFSTPPTILRRKRRSRVGPSPSSDSNSASFMDISTTSPKSTPVKVLPFSPSQFFNIYSGNDHLNLDNPALTSTPVCGQKLLVTTPLRKDQTPKVQKENAGFRTPTIRRTVLDSTPRTPTPFKNALAAQEKKYGPLRMVPQSLAHLEEDIREVLRKETGTDILFGDGIEPRFKMCDQERTAPFKKVRKSLVLDGWGKDNLSTQMFPQNSVSDAQSEILLTSSLLRVAMSEKPIATRRGNGTLCEIKQMSTSKSIRFETPRQMSSEWEAVACGKTEDQLIMTEQARRYLNAYNASNASRALIL